MSPEVVKEWIDRLEKVHLKSIEGPVYDLKRKIADLRKKSLRTGISLPPTMIISGIKPKNPF